MSHFAKVIDGKVVNAIVAELEFFDTFVDTSPGEWIQYSYNTRGGVHYQPGTDIPSEDQSKALRKNYAGLGFSYNRELDAFVPPKPYASWVLNEETCLWEAPTAMPTDGAIYSWNESTTSWDVVTETPHTV
jgi:hypothetical protein